MRRAALLLTLACGPVLLAVAPAQGAANRPASRASGTVRASWTAQEGEATAPGTSASRAEGTLRWTIAGRIGAFGEVASWLPGGYPEWSDGGRFEWPFLLRTTLTVEAFSAVTRAICGDGSPAETTTTVTAVPQPRGLLRQGLTRLDVPRGRGTTDIDVPLTERTDGGRVLASAFVGAGIVTTTTTGTDCLGSTEDGRTTPAAIEPRTADVSVPRLLGSEAFIAAVQQAQELPVRVGRDGSLRVLASLPQTRGRAPGVRVTARLEADVTLAGRLADHGADCALPDEPAMNRVRTLAGARGLLRRHGFPRAPLGAPMPRNQLQRRARFGLDTGSPAAPCGRSLGTRREPVLRPLSGGR